MVIVRGGVWEVEHRAEEARHRRELKKGKHQTSGLQNVDDAQPDDERDERRHRQRGARRRREHGYRHHLAGVATVAACIAWQATRAAPAERRREGDGDGQ